MTSHSRSCCGVVSMKLNQERRFCKYVKKKNFNFWIGTNCKQWFVVLFYRRMTWSRQTSTQSWRWVLIDTTPQVTRISPELKQHCLTLMLFLPIPCWFVSHLCLPVCLSLFPSHWSYYKNGSLICFSDSHHFSSGKQRQCVVRPGRLWEGQGVLQRGASEWFLMCGRIV